jgi:hypothetical protein
MDDFFALSADEQQAYFAQASTTLLLDAGSIEKDFWVCWVLRELFAVPGWGRHLTFKGGTSLSKGWQLIERFSEDIDIVIDRTLLDIEPPDEPGLSRNERERRLEKLKGACQQHVRDVLMPAFERRLRSRLPAHVAWSLSSDPDDVDGQTLLFNYPTVTSARAYVPQRVKIELGARSDIDPAHTPTIRPYLAEAFPAQIRDASFAVRAVAPERTFWEKAMLLHEEAHRREPKAPKERLARHYYDLWCLIKAGVAARAVASPELFERVVAHRSVFFRKHREAQATMRQGSIVLLPVAELLPAWAQDYGAMRESYFFREPPGFDEILRAVGEFERQFNGPAAAPSSA